jgi:ribose-phosphate pyrophosphokinase
LQRDLSQTIIIAPDMGNAKAAARFANDLGVPVAAANKERISDTQVRISGIVGENLQGRQHALIYDDEIATGGSILEMARVLIENGVSEISVACTHGLFTKNALDRLGAIPQVKDIITTDTVPIPPDKRHPKLHIISVAPVFGEAIRRNYLRQSIGDLFFFGE